MVLELSASRDLDKQRLQTPFDGRDTHKKLKDALLI